MKCTRCIPAGAVRVRSTENPGFPLVGLPNWVGRWGTFNPFPFPLSSWLVVFPLYRLGNSISPVTTQQEVKRKEVRGTRGGDGSGGRNWQGNRNVWPQRVELPPINPRYLSSAARRISSPRRHWICIVRSNKRVTLQPLD